MHILLLNKMNVKELTTQVLYKKYNYLTKIRAFPFKYEEVSNIFSDYNFIEAFKDKGVIFWHNLIHYTKIPMNILFVKYQTYLTNNELFLILKDSNKSFVFVKDIENIRKNLKAYFNEYNKYNK